MIGVKFVRNVIHNIMNSKFKEGNVVRLTHNMCFSSHNIGDIGKVIKVRCRSNQMENREGRNFVYLIERISDGHVNPNGTWSYESDLAISIAPLNTLTKVI